MGELASDVPRARAADIRRRGEGRFYRPQAGLADGGYSLGVLRTSSKSFGFAPELTLRGMAYSVLVPTVLLYVSEVWCKSTRDYSPGYI